MSRTVGVMAFAFLLLLPADMARTASAVVCNSYVKEAMAKAEGIRSYGCSFDGNDPRWTTEPSAHAAWCKTADTDAVARESAHRRGEIKLCQTCRTYATLAAAAAADNVNRKCGFDGPRWDGATEAHFDWCMAQYARPAADEKDRIATGQDALARLSAALNPETGRRAVMIALCRRRPATEAAPPR